MQNTFYLENKLLSGQFFSVYTCNISFVQNVNLQLNFKHHASQHQKLEF